MRRTWSIEYDGSEGIGEPEVCGDLPAIATKVIAEQREDQTGEDDHVDWLYEITPKVGLFLTGFRHDQEFDADDALWELRPTC